MAVFPVMESGMYTEKVMLLFIIYAFSIVVRLNTAPLPRVPWPPPTSFIIFYKVSSHDAALPPLSVSRAVRMPIPSSLVRIHMKNI